MAGFEPTAHLFIVQVTSMGLQHAVPCGALQASGKVCVWTCVGVSVRAVGFMPAHCKPAWTAVQTPSYSRFLLNTKMQGPEMFLKLQGFENRALKAEKGSGLQRICSFSCT